MRPTQNPTLPPLRPQHHHRSSAGGNWYHSFGSLWSPASWDSPSQNNHLPLPLRFQHAADRGPRAHHPLRRGLHEARRQPTVQRHICREGEGGVCSGREVGRGTHPRQPLPHYGALNACSSNPGRCFWWLLLLLVCNLFFYKVLQPVCGSETPSQKHCHSKVPSERNPRLDSLGTPWGHWGNASSCGGLSKSDLLWLRSSPADRLRTQARLVLKMQLGANLGNQTGTSGREREGP